MYILIAVYIDPYNILKEETNPNLIELKSQISYKINYPLYKLQEFSTNPTDIILLGDSRTAKLNPKAFEDLTDMSVSNLAYGGGTLPEVIDTFWYTTKVHNIKKVYIGLNFNLYNKLNSMDRVNEAIQLKNSPFSYLFSRYCFKSVYSILKSLVSNEIIHIERPKLSKTEFWQYQLQTSASNFYKNYQYPESYFEALEEISDYCSSNNIEVIFFVPPTHTELQQKVTEFKLNRAEDKFKSDLKRLGLVYDFDYENKMTENKDNFSDPFHYIDTIADVVTREIITGNTTFARTYSPTNN
ncbi:MAG: hypothetical protein BalsKO_06070 [Balneolaceae bacterium]